MAGIYIHIPFCSQACYYCDFHFSTSFKTVGRVLDCIKKEIVKQKNYLINQKVDTIYFGGGTPSLMDVSLIKQILTVIRKNFRFSNSIELTIEANPEDITFHKINEWFSAGINRVSVGVQSFRDSDLSSMNRAHNSRQAMECLELLMNSKIKNINVDLIYGLSKLEDLDWEKNLQKLIDFNVHHISCYCLTIEPKTPLFYLIKKGQYKQPDSIRGRSQFLVAREKLKQAGYEHYEISNFSKPGFSSRHNSNYWNKTFYLGIGPSAHSYNGSSRQWNIKNNNKYCDAIEKNQVHYKLETLTKKDMINEKILTSLRTSSGLLLKDCLDMMDSLQMDLFMIEVKNLEKKSLIKKEKNRIFLTESGMLMADSISAQLFLI